MKKLLLLCAYFEWLYACVWRCSLEHRCNLNCFMSWDELQWCCCEASLWSCLTQVTSWVHCQNFAKWTTFCIQIWTVAWLPDFSICLCFSFCLTFTVSAMEVQVGAVFCCVLFALWRWSVLAVWSHLKYDIFLAAKEALKRQIERVIRREFSVEIRKKEEEIELINQVFWHWYSAIQLYCNEADTQVLSPDPTTWVSRLENGCESSMLDFDITVSVLIYLFIIILYCEYTWIIIKAKK